MSFLAPWLFAAGAAAALAVVALHLLTTRRPPASPLPTARFVPETEARAVARASRPTDLLLLALRALAVLAVGAAFARPVLDAPGPSVRSVIAVEWSRDVMDHEALRSRVRSALNVGDALILFDTAAREIAAEAFDSLSAPSASLRGDAVSAMFIAARDAAARIARGADSLRLVVHAAVAPEDVDAATQALRATWPGRVELVPAAAGPPSAVRLDVDLRGAELDDPLAPAVRALVAQQREVVAEDPGPRAAMAPARSMHILRAAPEAADSSWLSAAPGRVLVLWPAIGERPATPDAVQAQLRGATRGGRSDAPTLVASLARIPLSEIAPGGAAIADTGAVQVIARWADGSPAALERALPGGSCVRRVGVGIPVAGDLTLRAPFARFLAAMLADCGGNSHEILADSSISWLTAAGPLAAAPTLANSSTDASPLAAWLLLLALALVAAEHFVRRRPTRGAA